MGVGAIIGVLSVIGFVLFIAGIGVVVMAASQGRPVRGGVLLAVVGLIFGLLFSIISQGILIVLPQEVAVVVNTLTGELEGNARRGGTHIILPVIQQPFLYPIVQQSVNMEGEARGTAEGAVIARTSDGQEVTLDMSVIYSIDPASANRLHLTWQNRYEDEFVLPTTRGVVRDAVSDFEAAEIYAGGRETLSNNAFERLESRLQRDGLSISDLIIRNITFSPQYAEAIEQAQVAAQEAQRARLQVQRIQQEAEQRRQQAQGERDAEILRAEGEAQAIVLRAQAEAEGLRLVSEQIAVNPALIQYQYIQRLSDQVGLILVPTSSPFLFDLASLPAALDNFTAPPVPEVSVPQVEIGEPDPLDVDPLPVPGG